MIKNDMIESIESFKLKIFNKVLVIITIYNKKNFYYKLNFK